MQAISCSLHDCNMANNISDIQTEMAMAILGQSHLSSLLLPRSFFLVKLCSCTRCMAPQYQSCFLSSCQAAQLNHHISPLSLTRGCRSHDGMCECAASGLSRRHLAGASKVRKLSLGSHDQQVGLCLGAEQCTQPSTGRASTGRRRQRGMTRLAVSFCCQRPHLEQ